MVHVEPLTHASASRLRGRLPDHVHPPMFTLFLTFRPVTRFVTGEGARIAIGHIQVVSARRSGFVL